MGATAYGRSDRVRARDPELTGPAKLGELSQRIRKRALYFRVSVVGQCNLKCPFCHNEGGPGHGRPTIDAIARAIELAASVGFTRVQYTGGEPLLRKDLDRLVRVAVQRVDDVGVTTNGTLLVQRWSSLVAAGITRLHISLQSEALRRGGPGNAWEMPDWLSWVCGRGGTDRPRIRLNMPVPMGEELQVGSFLEQLAPWGWDVKLFTLIPTGEATRLEAHRAAVQAIARDENERRLRAGQSGRIDVRGHLLPKGVRCPSCRDRERCVEQSRSLRLGSDGVLRPCLATRDWDLEFDPFAETARSTLQQATLLALDY